MNLLIMGPPGAGKGTQAEGLVKDLQITHVSTGDMFRAAIKAGTDMGKKAKEYMDRGELVPDSVVVGMVKDRISQPDCADKGFLLDGFPRTVPQAEALDETFKELGIKADGVINIAVPRERLMARLTGRRICRTCGASYHVIFNKPAEEGKCNCGGELYQRSDDNEVAVGNRLDIYEAQTQPLIDYYAKQGLLKNINGDQDINDVLVEVLASVK